MANRDFATEHRIVPNTLQEQSGITQNFANTSVKRLKPRTGNRSTNQQCLNKFEYRRVETTGLAKVSEHGVKAQIEIDPTDNFDMEALYLEASEIAGQRLTANQQLVMAMANQMVYEDLHPVTKAKVDKVISASSSGLDIQRIAAKLLNQYRQQIRTA